MNQKRRCNGYKVETYRLWTTSKHSFETKMCQASLPRADYKQQTSIIGLRSKKMRTLLTTTSQKATTPLWINSINTIKTKRQIPSLKDHFQRVQTRESKSKRTLILVSVLLSQCKSLTILQSKKIASRASCSRIALLTRRCTHPDLSRSHWLRMSFQLPTAQI
jgi:hypothetical protein